jgi:outer membrane protein OmpU|tara:strand:+ start:1104 stop:2042 length:939 start_codon:yes stop_codon:yes gene_type:complete
MNKLKMIGLTALGTTLIASSAFAAEMSVSGSASISFDDTNRGKAARGNGFYMGDSVKFKASGEMDNGVSVAVYYEMDGGSLDDHNIVLGLNDMGTLEFNGHGSSLAFGAVDDVMPQAYEESFDIIAGSDTNVINGVSGNGSFKYTSPTVQGATLAIGYINASDTVTDKSYTDYSIKFAPEMVEGLTLGYAQGDSEEVTGTTQDDTTMYIKYVYGPLSVGYQESERDINAASSDSESTAMGITYAVSDNFSIGYHEHSIDTEASTLDQDSTGISASYTAGSMTLGGAMNTSDNVGFTDADDLEGYEFTLSFAF